MKFDLGPSGDWAAQAIMLIYHQLMLMAILTTTVFRRELTESLEQVIDVTPFLTLGKLDEEQAEYARRNRNQPYPCGSGFKSKKCHAAPTG